MSQLAFRYLTPILILIAAPPGFAEEPRVDFAHDVVPILKKHCLECHGGAESKGGFSLNTRQLLLDAQVVVPGEPDQSYLIELLTTDDPELRMPKERPHLSEAEIAIVRRWIESELPWDEGLTFAEDAYEPPLVPRRPELPPITAGRENPVDRILDAYLAERGLPQPKPLDDARFMRRLFLDVLGLLPTPDQLEKFLADESPDKRQRLIDDVLNSEREYAEHWLTFWNDLLRNDYAGTGYIDGGREQITGWLYQSLLDNKPYDQFVRELISPKEGSRGFSQGIQWRGNVNASQQREVQFAQNISQVFLGINMKCASCHDSFIDHWTLEEAYGLAAIYATEPLELHRCDKPTGKMAQPAWIFPELGTIDPDATQPQRLEQLAELMTHPENGRLTRTIVNRLWHRLMGHGIVHPVDAMHTRPWNADLLDYLAIHLADSQYDLKESLRLIVSSQAYQSDAVEQEESGNEYVYRGPLAKRMTSEQFVDAIWQIAGDGPEKPDAQVQRPEPSGEFADFVRASLVKSNLLMRSLGRPNREQVVTTRPAELTTLEAIDLTNGHLLASMLNETATELLKRHPDRSAEELLEWLFQYALAREPDPAERSLALELLGPDPTQGEVEDLLWAVVMLPEFQLIR